MQETPTSPFLIPWLVGCPLPVALSRHFVTGISSVQFPSQTCRPAIPEQLSIWMEFTEAEGAGRGVQPKRVTDAHRVGRIKSKSLIVINMLKPDSPSLFFTKAQTCLAHVPEFWAPGEKGKLVALVTCQAFARTGQLAFGLAPGLVETMTSKGSLPSFPPWLSPSPERFPAKENPDFHCSWTVQDPREGWRSWSERRWIMSGNGIQRG